MNSPLIAARRYVEKADEAVRSEDVIVGGKIADC